MTRVAYGRQQPDTLVPCAALLMSNSNLEFDVIHIQKDLRPRRQHQPHTTPSLDVTTRVTGTKIESDEDVPRSCHAGGSYAVNQDFTSIGLRSTLKTDGRGNRPDTPIAPLRPRLRLRTSESVSMFSVGVARTDGCDAHGGGDRVCVEQPSGLPPHPASGVGWRVDQGCLQHTHSPVRERVRESPRLLTCCVARNVTAGQRLRLGPNTVETSSDSAGLRAIKLSVGLRGQERRESTKRTTTVPGGRAVVSFCSSTPGIEEGGGWDGVKAAAE